MARQTSCAAGTRSTSALAEEAEPYAREVDAAWLDRLDRELDNLRAALDWLETRGETQLVLRLAGALDDLWGAKGYMVEGPAARVLATGEALYKEIGGNPMGWLKRANDEALTMIHAQLDEASFAEASEQGRALTADEAVALALAALQ